MGWSDKMKLNFRLSSREWLVDDKPIGALAAPLKQKNCHNSPNLQPIITFFQGLFKFMKRHLLVIFSK